MMNTNFAQILVSKLKSSSTTLRVGLLSLVFTFVFLGMGTSSHAQSSTISGANKVDLSILNGYTFKKDQSYVITKLQDARQGLSASTDEVFTSLKSEFISLIATNLKTGNDVDVRLAVTNAYVSLTQVAQRFVNPDAKMKQAAQEVLAIIN